MDQEKKQANRAETAWNRMCRRTARLYAATVSSAYGRAMTAYRRVEGRLSSRRGMNGQAPCRPVSARRLAVAESVEQSLIVRLFSALLHGLYLCPLRVYGLFLLLCGAFQAVGFLLCRKVSAVAALVPQIPETRYLVWAVLPALVALPLLFTGMRLNEALSRSRGARLIFGRLLGIPLEATSSTHKKTPVWLLCLPVPVALLVVVASLWISPLFPLLVAAILSACGMIFAYPEAGAVLSTVLLPAAWLRQDDFLPTPLTVVILLTWISYGFKILTLRRKMRFEHLDAAVLALAVIVLLSGLIGPSVTLQGALRSVSLFLCLGVYFLIVNLIVSRAHVARCLFGLGVSAVALTVISYFAMLSPGELDWMAGSRAGNAIITLFQASLSGVSTLWNEQTACLLVLMTPLCYAGLVRARRLLPRVLLCLLLFAGVSLLVIHHAVIPLIGIAFITAIYCLLSGNKGPARGLIFIPIGTVFVVLLTFFAQPLLDALSDVITYTRYGMGTASEGLWSLVTRYPAGYSADTVRDCGNLFFAVLYNFGWQGLLIAVAVIFLFMQKSATALHYTVMQGNRCLVTATLSVIMGMLFYGAVSTVIFNPGVLLTLVLLVALSSTYENILFDETDIYMAESMNSAGGVDRMIRKW